MATNKMHKNILVIITKRMTPVKVFLFFCLAILVPTIKINTDKITKKAIVAQESACAL
jgi:hypothetical protein